MATIVATLKIMPESPELSETRLLEESTKFIEEFGAKVERHEIEPIAFGLNALNITISVDEDKGGLDPLEEKLTSIDGILSVQVTSVSRTLG